MAQYDLSRTGANTQETVLRPSNLYKLKVDARLQVSGDIRNQPLVVEGVVISGTSRTVLVVATQDDNIYAFDADPATNGTAAYWSRNVGSQFLVAKTGCSPTPTVDITSKILYEVCSGSTGTLTAYGIHLEDGTDAITPVTVSATSGSHTFTALTNNIGGLKPGLVLANNRLYLSLKDCEDSNGNITCPERGWIIGLNKSTLATEVAWPLNSIWMSGGAPAVDSDGNLYVTTGNDTFDGTTQFGESVVKLNPSLVVQDYFTPSNWSSLNGGDLDVGSSHPILLSDSWVISGGKDGRHFLLSTSDMGHLQGGGGTAPAQIVSGQNEFSQIVFANNSLYIGSQAAGIVNGVPIQVSRYPYNGSTFDAMSGQSVGRTFATMGIALTYSSNGADMNTAVLWGVTCATADGPATVRAWNAITLQEIWDSDSAGQRVMGDRSHFMMPVVANGHLYISTGSGLIVVYGLDKTPAATFGATIIQ